MAGSIPSLEQIPKQAFEHQPLQPNEIRLLCFKSASDGTPELSLAHFRKDDAPQYKALSYTWGLRGNESPILLDGKVFEIRDNLATFLDELASRATAEPSAHRWWWVDALCINQNDDIEKSQQVAKMRSIYEDASRVVIWLGPEKDDSDLAMLLLNDVANIEFENITDLHRFLNTFHERHSQHSKTRLWKAYGHLIARPWGSRAWIVQEASVATIPLVWCGKATSDLNAFFKVERRLNVAGFLSFTPSAESGESFTAAAKPDSFWIRNDWIGIISLTTYAVKNGTPESPSEVINILHGSRRHACQDPRDKIFAFLFLFASNRLYEVDYTKSIRETYVSFAKAYLLHTGWEILSACTDFQGDQYRLPSWVPDWSVEGMPSIFAKYPWVPRTSTSQALYAASSGLDETPPTFIDPDILSLRGITVAKIQAVSQVWNDISKHVETGDAWVEFNRENGNDGNAFAEVLCVDMEDESGARGGGVSIRHVQSAVLAGTYAEPYLMHTAMHYHTWQRRLFYTDKDHLGLGPPGAQPGDIVCVIGNCSMPFVLRPVSSYAYFKIVGEAYVYGIMDGEAVTPDAKLEDFRVI